MCAAVKGRVGIRDGDGERVVAMDDFHVGPYMTAVQSGEPADGDPAPARSGAGSAHEKSSGARAVGRSAAASAAVWMDGGTIAEAGSRSPRSG